MPKSKKLRLDVLLVERGLFPTRAKAQAAILADLIRVGGKGGLKAGQELPEDAEVEVIAPACPYVSRGGLKLEAALDRFNISPAGRTAIDIGSSTGGFTDCLLQRGAARVYAVDVGTAQLDVKLRTDKRVVVMEQTHVRDLHEGLFDPLPDLAVIDVSFISLTKVLPFVLPCLKTTAEIIALIKPQFELEPKKVPHGIVREEAYRKEAIDSVFNTTDRLGLLRSEPIMSPIKGAKGNIEHLCCFRRIAKC